MTAPGTGHVAPDFEKPATHFNTLRVRPEYRISLKLGDIEELFPNKPDSHEGRVERMQVLGLYYFPLKHSNIFSEAVAAAAEALGVGGSDENKPKDPYVECWKWFKTKILKVGVDDNAKADDALQKGLKSRVVSPAAIPNWSAGPTALPPDAADPKKPGAGNFAKIRVPGGYTIGNATGDGRLLNAASGYSEAKAGGSLYDYESLFYKLNRVLGKIPLIAKVEKRATPTADWTPAPDVSVCFQLVKPYAEDQPAYASGTAASGQIARPPLRATLGDSPETGSGIGPKKKVEAMEAHHLDPNDPQWKNCHKDHGGKRGSGDLLSGADVDNVIFSTTSMLGFNEKHENAERKMSHKPYPVAARMDPVDGKHKHAVKAKTNEDGEAGVLFMPSRMGGDRYRLRAYVGPPSLESDGEQVGSVAVTTGTFVVWRNIRMSRYIKHDATDPPDARLVQAGEGAPVDDAKNKAYLEMASLAGMAASGAAAITYLGFDTVDFADPSGGTPPFDAIPLQFARAFCEIEMDAGNPNAELLSQEEWNAARAVAVADAKIGARSLSIDLDIDKLFWTDIFATVDKTVTHLIMRLPADYNASLPADSPQKLTIILDVLEKGEADRIKTLLRSYAIAGFTRSLSKDGALPGLTLITGGFGDSWQLYRHNAGNTGIALDYRAPAVWNGKGTYPPNFGSGAGYNFTSNAIHEIGHTLFRQHALSRPGFASQAKGANPDVHDSIVDSICVMSYDKPIVGQFCGRCLLGFRGWKPE